jgi:hypothetical protein
MGEVQEAVHPVKCQIFQFRITQDFSRRQKADRCGSTSKMGTSESTTSKDSRVVVEIQSFRGPVYKSGLLDS